MAILGVDVGKKRDPAALALIVPDGPRRVGPRPRWRLLSAVRLELGTPYADIALRAAGVARAVRSAGGTVFVVVDGSGVGDAVVEALRAERVCEVVSLVTTGGQHAGGCWPDLTAPKALQVDHLAVAWEQDAFTIDAGAGLGGRVLADEMATLRRDERGRWHVGGGAHGDVLAAVCAAVYTGDVVTEDAARTARHVETEAV